MQEDSSHFRVHQYLPLLLHDQLADGFEVVLLDRRGNFLDHLIFGRIGDRQIHRQHDVLIVERVSDENRLIFRRAPDPLTDVRQRLRLAFEVILGRHHIVQVSPGIEEEFIDEDKVEELSKVR